MNLISQTTTTEGLEIRAMLDENTYHTGIEVSDQDFDAIALHFAFHDGIEPTNNAAEQPLRPAVIRYSLKAKPLEGLPIGCYQEAISVRSPCYCRGEC